MTLQTSTDMPCCANITEYRISDSVSVAANVPFPRTGTIPRWWAMIGCSEFGQLTDDMRMYLESEAARRKTDIGTVYDEEMAAKAELAQITPKNEDLLKLADRFPAPQEWYDE